MCELQRIGTWGECCVKAYPGCSDTDVEVWLLPGYVLLQRPMMSTAEYVPIHVWDVMRRSMQ